MNYIIMIIYSINRMVCKIHTKNLFQEGCISMPYKKEYHQLTCSRCNQVFEVLTPAYLRRLKDPKYGTICPTCRRRIQQEEMTPEERKRRTEKALVSRKKTLENMDPEQRAAWTKNKSEKVKKAWANMDEDQKKDLSERRSKIQSDRMANMSEEQLAVIGKNISIGKKLAFANMSEEQREANRERMREERKVYWASRTDEQKEEIIDRLRKNAREFWDDESNKEKQDMIIDNLKKGVRDYWDNISEEDKQQSLDRLNAGYRNWYDNLSEDELIEFSKRSSENTKNWWDSLSDDEREAVIQKRNEIMEEKWKDPEYRRNFSEKRKEAHRRRLENMTEEERKEYAERNAERSRNMWKNFSPEKRQEIIDNAKQRFANMSEEQRNEFIRKVSEGNKRFYENMSDEEFHRRQEISRQRWINMSPDDREEFVRKKLYNRDTTNMKKTNQEFEKKFADSMLINDFYYQKEIECKNNGVSHVWDYGIYDKNDKLVMVVDVDGVYYHADVCDYDGIHSCEEKDEVRGLSVPDGVKCTIVYEHSFTYSFDRMFKLLYTNYDQYIDDMVTEMKRFGFPEVNYSNRYLEKSFYALKRFDVNNESRSPLKFNSRVGDALIKHFHHSIYYAHRKGKPSPYEAWNDDRLLRKTIENRVIYQNHLNPNKILQGFNVSRIAPKVSVFSASRAKYIINKYLSEFDTIFDPFSGFSGRLLGAASLDKTYIGQDISSIAVNESNQIINFLNDDLYHYDIKATITQADSSITTGEYPCLFTCPPYGDLEQWFEVPIDYHTCDDWIDICLKNYKCKRYVFVVNKTDKYKEYIVDTITNRSHVTSSDEYVVVINK